MNLNIDFEKPVMNKKTGKLQTLTIKQDLTHPYLNIYPKYSKIRCRNPVSFELWKEMFREHLYNLLEIFLSDIKKNHNIHIYPETIEESFYYFLYKQSSKFRI
jgi:hypothetical protein